MYHSFTWIWLLKENILSLVVWRRRSLAALQWRQNERDGVPNQQLNDCILNRLFRRRSKEASKLRVTGLCAGNSPVAGEFPAQRASNADNVSIWWRHHGHQAEESNAASGGFRRLMPASDLQTHYTQQVCVLLLYRTFKLFYVIKKYTDILRFLFRTDQLLLVAYGLASTGR